MLSGRTLYLGTDEGLSGFDGTEQTITTSVLDGQPVRDLEIDTASDGTVWAGSALGGSGLYRIDARGDSVESVGFENEWVWGVDRLPDGHLYVGTEPPGLYRHDADGFTALEGIHDVSGREEWTFGYEPFEAGHVHGITAHADRPERLFAAVEIGGILVSDDGGETWELRLQGEDVHRLAFAPDSADHVFAATETGVYESEDGGATWHVVEATDGLYVKLLRHGPDGTLFAPAATDMGDTDVQLYAYDSRWNRRGTVSGASVLAFGLVDGTFLLQQAGETGRLLVSNDGDEWEAVGPSIPRIRCIQSATGQSS